MGETPEFETIATVKVIPDPGVLRAIGLSHGLDSALADLVDNAIDAHASRVLIRFVRHGSNIRRVLVVDDGVGMDADAVDDAMQLGRPKLDSHSSLGHFGMGLKAATFSQAARLTVLTRRAGSTPQGRRMARDDNSGFEVDVLATDQIDAALDSDWIGFPAGKPATAVLWDELETFPAANDPTVTDEFLEKNVALVRRHLGMIFHRLLDRDVVRIDLDVFDEESEDAGLPFDVAAVDPFGYARSGSAGFPKILTAKCRDAEVSLRCHIWPAGSDSHQFKLDGPLVDKFQGFYFYRNDRLLKAGGWGGAAKEGKKRKLARVEVDVESHLGLFMMSSEKHSVRMTADLVRAVESAVASDGTTFTDYLDAAESTFTVGNQRERRRAKMLPAGQGLPPRVKRTLEREVEILEGEDPVAIRWMQFDSDDHDFLWVDRSSNTLMLNERYRTAVLKGVAGSLNDVPIMKTLIFLLFEEIFRGAAYGPKDKDNVAFWTEMLNAAAREEYDAF